MNPDENAASSHEVNPAMLSRSRSSHRRLSGIDAMVNAVDGRASVRADHRKSVRASQRSSASASLCAPGVVAFENEDEDDDAAPSEAEKTMTVWSGAILLSQSMLGGGGCSLILSFISTRLQPFTLASQVDTFWHTAALNLASCWQLCSWRFSVFLH